MNKKNPIFLQITLTLKSLLVASVCESEVVVVFVEAEEVNEAELGAELVFMEEAATTEEGGCEAVEDDRLWLIGMAPGEI